jgi:hypothetical protein
MGQRSYADEAAEHKLAPARLSAGSPSPLLQLEVGRRHAGERASASGWTRPSAWTASSSSATRWWARARSTRRPGNVRDARNAWTKAASAIETNLMALERRRARRDHAQRPPRHAAPLRGPGGTRRDRRGGRGEGRRRRRRWWGLRLRLRWWPRPRPPRRLRHERRKHAGCRYVSSPLASPAV